jgi:hypothetical protein
VTKTVAYSGTELVMAVKFLARASILIRAVISFIISGVGHYHKVTAIINFFL